MENLISIIISLIIIALSLISGMFQAPRFVFMDVKQGDSMLFVKNDFEIVVDGGPGDYLIQNIGKYIPFYDRKIELVVLTHPHLDHYAGLIELLKRFKVENILVPKPPCRFDPVYSIFLQVLKEKQIRIVDEVGFEIDGLEVKSMSNFNNECVNGQEEANNSSVITSFKYNGIKILNLGDLEKDNEAFIQKQDVEVLKAGHHCSKTSTSPQLIEKVTPELVICSYGENSYGHPSLNLLDFLKDNGIGVFSTFDNGDIILNLKEKVIYNEKGKIIKKL